MFNIKSAIFLLPIVASLSYIAADDLSSYELKQQCVGKEMEIISYPADENRFIVCVNEKPQVGECREDKDPQDATKTKKTCFDESEKKCDLAFCDASSDGPDTAYKLFVKSFCEKDDNFAVKLPAEDCEHFYMCLGSNNPYAYQACPHGKHFSRVTKDCEAPLEASCQSLDTMCDDKSNGYRFSSLNCYDYYECRKKRPIARTCTYGQHFDPVTQECISAKNSKCEDQTVRAPKCKETDNGKYFQHQKCNRFYVCVNTVPLEAQCPQDFYFDEPNQMCRRDNAGICRA